MRSSHGSKINSEVLSRSRLIYLNCLDLHSQTYIKLSNLACQFSTVMGHVSFPNALRERRLCLFLRTEKVKDLEEMASPAVINVKSSCIHEENQLPVPLRFLFSLITVLIFCVTCSLLKLYQLHSLRSLYLRTFTFVHVSGTSTSMILM